MDDGYQHCSDLERLAKLGGNVEEVAEHVHDKAELAQLHEP